MMAISKPSARTAWPRPSGASSDAEATRCQLPTIRLTSDDDVLRSFERQNAIFHRLRHADLLVGRVIEHDLHRATFSDEPPRSFFKDVVMEIEARATDRRDANADQDAVFIRGLRSVIQFRAGDDEARRTRAARS